MHSDKRVVAVIKRQAWGPSSSLYVHVDHLGSVDVITDQTGAVKDKRSYDAFGARRNPIWGAPPPQGPFSSEASLGFTGFTGHEEDDELGLVNMKGRLYDPNLARFLTPDPIISTSTFGQSWNAYSYVQNSPLSYVDPTGFTEEEPEKEILPIAVYEKLGPDGNPTEVHLVYPPRRPKPSAKEEQSEPAEVGATTAPTDMRVWGNTAGHVPEPSPVAPSIPPEISVSAEVAIGVAEGLGEITLDIARGLVLQALTAGSYGSYQMGTAMWEGYQEDGLPGALNAINPLYWIGRGAADTYIAAEKGDYRAATAAGLKTAVVVAATAATAAQGVGALGP